MATRRKRLKNTTKEPASKGFSFGTSNRNLILVGIFLVGIFAYTSLSGRSSAGENGAVSSGDIKQISLPSYAYKNKKTVDAYTKATKIPHILEWLPCYCGCGGHSQHKHNKNCFFKDDGSFEPHGADCEMCLDIAISAYEWYTNGVPLQEIRNRIERAYGGRFGDPTPTPPVPDYLKDLTVDKDDKFASL